MGGRAGAGGRLGCGRGQRGSCRSRIMSLTRNAPSPSPPPEQGKLLSGEGGGLEAGSPLGAGEGSRTGFLGTVRGLVSNSLPPSGSRSEETPF